MRKTDKEMKLRGGARYWLAIAALLVVQLAVWVGWLAMAGRHRVAEVPLITTR